MPLQLGTVQITFEVYLVCPTCDFRELPGDLADRESAKIQVEETREGEVGTYCCWGCGRRRYLDEAIRTRDVRICKPKPEEES